MVEVKATETGKSSSTENGLAPHDELLRSTVRLARLSFGAAAASVFLYDRGRDQLVFEACSGEGEDMLIGIAIPSDRGIAGWVANTGETIVVREAGTDEHFDQEFAASTGFVPDVILAAPLEHDGEVLGVLEVLDPALDTFGDIAAIDLLTELANQSSVSLALLAGSRNEQARHTTAADTIGRLRQLLETADESRIALVEDIITAACGLLSGAPS